jgi:glutathione peroxidase
MKFYDFKANNMAGQEVAMETFKGKVVLVVNTASKCGFTPQFKELETLYEKYKEQGLIVLGFPSNQFANQDPGSNEEINEFCQLNYGVTFPMFQKIEVNGDGAHPLFQFLTEETKTVFGKKVKWNFTKFLIDSQGNIMKRYAPTKSPMSFESDIQSLLPSEPDEIA